MEEWKSTSNESIKLSVSKFQTPTSLIVTRTEANLLYYVNNS